MNYLFFTIVFLNICNIELIPYNYNVSVRKTKSDIIKTTHNINNLEKERKNEEKIKKRQVLSQIIDKTNVPGTTNLKSNIFDKMLSDEMLSIKQHFYEKDSSYTPSVQIILNGNGATPTLEVKQKWATTNMASKSFTNDYNYSRKLPDNNGRITVQNDFSYQNQNASLNSCEQICKDQISNKILGLRSLPEAHISDMNCDCMKSNPRPTCSQRCTGMGSSKEKSICTHTPKDKKLHRDCTRTTPSKYSVIYVTYPYFWQISTYSIKPYHPNPINEIKISKTKKHRKNKKPYMYVEKNDVDKIFEGETYQEKNNYLNSDEYYYDYEIDKLSNRKEKQNIPHDTIQDIEYEESDSKKLHIVDTESFIDNVVKDLKKDYSDVAIKDCYCSSSSRNSDLKNTLLRHLFWIYLYMLLLC